MIPAGTIRVVSRPVSPTAAQAAIDEQIRALTEQLTQRRESMISALATTAVPLHRPDMLGALHIVEIDTPPDVVVGAGPARAADLVTMSIDCPVPTLASFWPWRPGDARDRIETLSELLT